jgi:hypothetical protein
MPLPPREGGFKEAANCYSLARSFWPVRTPERDCETSKSPVSTTHTNTASTSQPLSSGNGHFEKVVEAIRARSN